MTVTVAILAKHGVAGDEEALQSLIDDAYADIEARFGPNGELIEDRVVVPHARRIWPKRRIEAVLKLWHGPTFKTEDLVELLPNVDDGYMVYGNQWIVQKLDGSFNRCVRIKYRPFSDAHRRDRVVIDLVKLSHSFKGGGTVTSKRVGNLSVSYSGASSGGDQNYYTQREAILNGLAVGQRMLA